MESPLQLQRLIGDLESLPGVRGSIFVDDRGHILARAFPPDYDDSALQEAAVAVADGALGLRATTGDVGLVELSYQDARLLLHPVGTGTLMLLCAKSANVEDLLPPVSRVGKALEGLTPVAPDRQPPIEPEPSRGTPPRRRRFPTLLVSGAAAALLVMAGLAYHLSRPTTVETPPVATGPTPAPPRPPPAPKARGGPTQVVLRIAGSDTLSSQLVPALGGAYLSTLQVKDVGPTQLETGALAIQGEKDGKAWTIPVTRSGAAQGFEELLAGSADVVIATRRIRSEESSRLAALGSMTSQANEHVIALNGIALIVNMGNPVSKLNRAQMASIFSGVTSDWSALGVTGDEDMEWSMLGVGGQRGTLGTGINPYLPDDRSGLTEAFQLAVLGKTPFSSGAKRLPDFQAVTDAVIADPGGVGFVPLPFARGAKVLAVADLDDPPMIATPFTVATEDYFLTQRIYLYTAQASTNPNVSKFAEFVLGPKGQAAIKDSGFVELAIKAEQRAVPAGAPRDYVRLVAGARQLSSTFRFEVNSFLFDNRALRDMERAVQFLHDRGLNGAAIRVLGFTDAQGSAARNRKLSADRAKLVAQALAKGGFRGVTVAGFGSALPVASNATEEGRQRNRRVEIWVAR